MLVNYFFFKGFFFFGFRGVCSKAPLNVKDKKFSCVAFAFSYGLSGIFF